jgi:hypothetical protein
LIRENVEKNLGRVSKNKENEATSVTKRFEKKSAKFCPNIAQNGALLNKNIFCPKKILVKIWEF